MRTPLLFASVSVVSLAGLLACSSESSSSPSGSSSSSSSGSSSPTVTAQQCSSRCQTKMTSCQAPSNVVTQGCGQLCGNTLTEAQLSCFEGKSCEELAKAESFDALCPAGSSSSSSSTSSSSSSSSSSGGGGLPTALTVSGTFPSSTKAIHVKGSDGKTIASNVSVSATPSFSPSQPSQLPDVTKAASVTIKSPNKGSCNANITFTLNGSQAAVSITGQDTLPATDCATFTDAVASQGILAELADAPYPNSSTKAKVTFDLEP